MTDDKTTPDTPEDAHALGDETRAIVTPEQSTIEGQPAAVTASEPSAPDEVADVAAEDPRASVAADEPVAVDEPDAVVEDAAAQYGIGPFSVREVAIGAVWVVAFVVSFFPIYGLFGEGGTSVWARGIDWMLTIGAPTVAVFLLALRRLSPQGIRRVGSLGIDQFASVAFSIASILWLGLLVGSFVTVGGRSVILATWVVWVEFILMLAGVMLTVFASLFPTIREDFQHRTETVAHRSARPARPVVARPTPEPAAPAAATTIAEPVVEQAAQEPARVAASQAFWALAPEERTVVDEQGAPLFTIGPLAWALVIEERGDVFVVRHEDGRIGYLHDTSDVTRG
ncbi:hypothetical protein [Microbacterium sp. bgisy189]|uniref:hypothetical protein n=1 Tax=Microbacterium sp. bgisy189 TaxID=3413798 RepID=UPI003EBB0CF8